MTWLVFLKCPSGCQGSESVSERVHERMNQVVCPYYAPRTELGSGEGRCAGTLGRMETHLAKAPPSV